MPTMDEVQQSIDDITARMDDSDSSLQDFSDSIDSSFNDVQSSLDDHSSSLDELSTNEGQLMFPLTQDTIDLITEQTPAMLQYMVNQGYIGIIPLSGGTVTITTPLVSSSSLVLVSRAVSSGTTGVLSYVSSAGSLVINSDSATDTSTIIYFILN